MTETEKQPQEIQEIKNSEKKEEKTKKTKKIETQKQANTKQLGVDNVKLIKELTEKTRQRLETLREFPVLLKTKEAAHYLGVSGSIMNQWRVDGIGPRYHKFEGSIRYSTLGLLDYVETNEYQSTSQTTASKSH